MSPPSQVQTFPLGEGNLSPSSPRIYLFINSCVFTSLSPLICITFFPLFLQNTIPGLSVGKYDQNNSCYLSVFHTVVFLLSLVFFFFFSSLSLPFFPRVEQIQWNWQKIGKLQQSRGSDFFSKYLNGVCIFCYCFLSLEVVWVFKKRDNSSNPLPFLLLPTLLESPRTYKNSSELSLFQKSAGLVTGINEGGGIIHVFFWIIHGIIHVFLDKSI